MLILQSSVNNITGPQTGPCVLYETYSSNAPQGMYDPGSNTWYIPSGLHYVLNSDEIAASESQLDNTTQDSTGIPITPLLMRYVEVPLGVQHPLRIAFPLPTNWFVWPATGCCGGTGPPQGLLYRLKASVNWQATCPVSQYPQAATVLQALQQYGAYMSDHGGTGYVGGVPDIRWNDNDLACIKKFHVSDLEVVDNSALEVSDISGQTKPYVVPATLPNSTVGIAYSATIAAVGGNPATRQFSVSAGALPPGLSLDSSSGVIGGQPTASAGSPYSFQVTATDTASGYASAAQTFTLTVASTPVATTFASTPSGLSVVVDGTSYTTPQTLNLSQGAHSIAASTPQPGSGAQYLFTSWSDGGAASHSITVGTSATTYTASFKTQYYLTTAAGAGGSITPPSGWYDAGSAVSVAALPGAGYVFAGFSGGLSGAGTPQNVIMNAARSVTATFDPNPATTNILSAGSASATPGSTFSIPVRLSLIGGVNASALTFGLQIVPAGSAPALTGSLTFTKDASITDVPFTSTGATANSIAVVWSSLSSPFSGAGTLGVVNGTLPSGAAPGQSYAVEITGFSAASGGGVNPIAVSAGANGVLDVLAASAATYLEGDVFPFKSDTAPNFGDGILNILDLTQMLFAVNNVPGFTPAACSDRYDAMDVYPVDTASTRGGDGVLDIRDLATEMFRVDNLDPARPARVSLGGVCPVQAEGAAGVTVTATSRATGPGADGVLRWGNAERVTAVEDRIPVYLEATRDLSQIALTLALGDQRSQLHFVAAPDTPPSLARDGQVGVVALAWLEGVTLRAGERRLLGYVTGPAGALTGLRLYGSSARGLHDNREVRVALPDWADSAGSAR
jgi:hypothetical protein